MISYLNHSHTWTPTLLSQDPDQDLYHPAHSIFLAFSITCGVVMATDSTAHQLPAPSDAPVTGTGVAPIRLTTTRPGRALKGPTRGRSYQCRSASHERNTKISEDSRVWPTGFRPYAPYGGVSQHTEGSSNDPLHESPRCQHEVTRNRLGSHVPDNNIHAQRRL